MDELVIQYHDFENAKKELKEFSEQTPAHLDLKEVESVKGLGEFVGDFFLGRGIGLDHKVTGDELNELTENLQRYFREFNDTQIKLIKEFGQVYSALEALDKDYIQAILISVKAAEETSEGVKTAQEQIKRVVGNQRKTLEELGRFKRKLDGYAHLEDIDEIWESLRAVQDYIRNIGGDIEKIRKSLTETETKNAAAVREANGMIASLTEAETENAAVFRETNGMIVSLAKKVKYACWIAGGAAVLAIIELILLLL